MIHKDIIKKRPWDTAMTGTEEPLKNIETNKRRILVSSYDISTGCLLFCKNKQPIDTSYKETSRVSGFAEKKNKIKLK